LLVSFVKHGYKLQNVQFENFSTHCDEPGHCTVCLNLRQLFIFYSYLAECLQLFLFGRIVKTTIRYKPNHGASHDSHHWQNLNKINIKSQDYMPVAGTYK